MQQKVYIIENLDCAHCAARVEDKINAMAEVEAATITFATKQLRITAEDPDALLPQILAVARKVEADVVIIPRESRGGDDLVSLTISLKDAVFGAEKANALHAY